MSASEAVKHNEQQDGVELSDGAGAPAVAASAANDSPGGFERLLGDVPLLVTVELGRVRMSLREIGQQLSPGAVISLSKLTGESLDVRINDRLVARAEAVALGERYGIRMVEILDGAGR